MSAVDKTETSTFSWLDLAFGFQKYRRKTIGFGQFNKKERCWEDEVHVRELSFTQGGVGCALWDAAILLCHWIHDNGANVLEDKKVLELGSGTGAPGILSARFANLVYLTDYTEEILDNLQYNIWLNCQDLQNKGLYELESKVATSARVEYLDWDRYQQGTINETFDVVIGSELTYYSSHVAPLLNTVEYFMKSQGTFYEILGENREGVELFMSECLSRGFQVDISPLSLEVLKTCRTKQRLENYYLYTVHKNKGSNTE